MEMTTNSLTVWFAIWSESSLLLHAIKHVLWAMAKANSFNYTGVFFFFLWGWGGGRRECGSAMRDLLLVPVLCDVYANCKMRCFGIGILA